MAPHSVDVFDRAQQTAHSWVADVSSAFENQDPRVAYRVLRAWLHTLRDRLTVEGAATFAAELPELLRGVYYDGWQPHQAPIKYSRDQYLQRFAAEARIPVGEVSWAAGTVGSTLARRLSPGKLASTLTQLPVPLRTLIGGDGNGNGNGAARRTPRSVTPVAEAVTVRPDPGAGTTTDELLNELKERVDLLSEAVRTLAGGFVEEPGAGVDEGHRARSAHLAAEMLMAERAQGDRSGSA